MGARIFLRTPGDVFNHLLGEQGSDGIEYPDEEVLFVVDTPNGMAVFANETAAVAYSATSGGAVEKRLGIQIPGDKYLLLDKDTPVVNLGVPPSKEDIRKNALKKLSREERNALGL